MAVYTVVIDTGDAEQDDVLEELEQLPSVVLVQFMGPGSLVDPPAVQPPAGFNYGLVAGLLFCLVVWAGVSALAGVL